MDTNIELKVEKNEDEGLKIALNKLTAIIMAKLLLNSKCAIHVPPELYDKSEDDIDISVKFNEDRSLILLSGQVLNLKQIEADKMKLSNALIDTKNVDAIPFNGWMDYAKSSPPIGEFVLCVSQYKDSPVPVIAALKLNNEGQPIFVTNYKINGEWAAFKMTGITHWQPLPFPPKYEEGEKFESVKKNMPFTQERKRKKK